MFLVVLGARRWRRRPQDPSQAELPKWTGTIDRLTPVRVFGLGTAFAALNPKNAPLTIAAGARHRLGSAGVPVGQQIAALAVFVAIATLGLLAPLGVFRLGGRRAWTMLGDGISVRLRTTPALPQAFRSHGSVNSRPSR